MEELTDDQILEMFHDEKTYQQAFKILVDKYKERIYWHVRKIVMNHEDADDLVQNVFVKVWYGLQDFRNDAKLFTWIYRIATNEALNMLSEKRRKTYGNTVEINEVLSNNLESDPYFDGDKIQLELQKAILGLSEKQRLVFNLRYYDEMTYEQMADVLELAVGTLKSTYHTAVKKIESSMKIVEESDFGM